ncbi:MAG: DUF503 domain-containing protein [bacterium]|nr:DUF503 domain-containing protein [bacterium]MDE0288996.1 DUF503 domain-containing protein [bacterium]MDE0439920.1 DUF503 domain-containing protein [bacterium]
MAALHAAALRVDLRLRDVHSLKSKRRRIARLSAALRRAFPVAFAEVDFQDLWQRSAVGVGIVSPHASQLEMAIHSVHRFLERWEETEVLSVRVSYLEDPD